MREATLALILLMPGLAWADEPQLFDPVVVDVEVDGETLSGVLVDEPTIEELIQLRAETKSLSLEVEALEKRLATQLEIEVSVRESLRSHHEQQMTVMRDFYSARLDESYKRSLREKHGFEIGVGVGVVGTVAAVVVTGYALGQVSNQ